MAISRVSTQGWAVVIERLRHHGERLGLRQRPGHEMRQLRRAHRPDCGVAQDAAPFEIAVERADGRELPGEAAAAHPAIAPRRQERPEIGREQPFERLEIGRLAEMVLQKPPELGEIARIGLDGLGGRPPPAGKAAEPGLHLNRRFRRQSEGNRFRLPVHSPIMARAPYSQVNEGVAIEAAEVASRRARPRPGIMVAATSFPARKGIVHEVACACGGDRRRRGRGLDALCIWPRRAGRDVVLLERKELTSGSTWHAAGLLPLFNLSYSVGQIHKYSVKLYQALEAETGQHVGFRKVLQHQARPHPGPLGRVQYYAGVAETIGVKVNVLTPEEVKEIWPLCEHRWHPRRHPASRRRLYPARRSHPGARQGGPRPRGPDPPQDHASPPSRRSRPANGWSRPTRATSAAEHVVSAPAISCARPARCSASTSRSSRSSTNISSPSRIPAIVERQRRACRRWACCARPIRSWYMREENGGLLLGPYETRRARLLCRRPGREGRV